MWFNALVLLFPPGPSLRVLQNISSDAMRMLLKVQLTQDVCFNIHVDGQGILRCPTGGCDEIHQGLSRLIDARMALASDAHLLTCHTSDSTSLASGLHVNWRIMVHKHDGEG